MTATSASMSAMQKSIPHQEMQQRVAQTSGLLTDIRRKMESLVAENHRLKEIARLSESELKARSERMRKLELRVQELDHARIESRARVAQSMEGLDGIIANINKERE